MVEMEAASRQWRQAEIGGLTRQLLLNKENELLFGEGCLAAGEENIRHLHDYGDEIIYLLQGEVKCMVGPKTVLLKSGDCYCIPKGVSHKLINRMDDGVRYLFIIHPLAPTPSQGHRIIE